MNRWIGYKVYYMDEYKGIVLYRKDHLIYFLNPKSNYSDKINFASLDDMNIRLSL